LGLSILHRCLLDLYGKDEPAQLDALFWLAFSELPPLVLDCVDLGHRDPLELWKDPGEIPNLRMTREGIPNVPRREI